MWGKFDLKTWNRNYPVPSPRPFAFLFATIFFIFGILKLNPFFMVLGLILGVVGIFNPKLVGPLNRWWHQLGLIMSWFTTPLVLSMLYFVFFAPLAVVMKLFGHKGLPQGPRWILKNKPTRFDRIF